MEYEKMREYAEEPARHAPGPFRGIVSPSNHATDYVEKMHDHPAMGIPLYLLIDPRKGTIAALSDPGPTPGGDGPRYRTRSDYAFGDTVTIGDWTIETGDLHTYPDG